MKRAITLLAFIIGLSLTAAEPPYLRNFFDTNLNPVVQVTAGSNVFVGYTQAGQTRTYHVDVNTTVYGTNLPPALQPLVTNNAVDLTNLNASALASGTIPMGRVTTNTAAAGSIMYSQTGNERVWSTNLIYDGINLTNNGIAAGWGVNAGGTNWAKKLILGTAANVSSTLHVAGVSYFNNSADVSSGLTGAAMSTSGGLYVSKQTTVISNLNVGQNLTVTNTTLHLDDVTLGPAADLVAQGSNYFSGPIYATGIVQRLEAGGANTLVVTNGRVGIGVANPTVNLDLSTGTVKGGSLLGSSFADRVYNTAVLTPDGASGNWTVRTNVSIVGTLTVTNGITTPNTLTCSNLVLSTVKWDDAPYQFFWPSTGQSQPPITPVVSGSLLKYMGFTVGGIGTEVAHASAQISHRVAPSNSTLYVEPHLHASPTTTVDQNTNVAFRCIYDFSSINGTRYGPLTNIVQVGFGTNTFNNLMELPHVWATNWFPGISDISRITIYRYAATSNAYTGDVILDAADIHYPVTVMGSGSDNTP